jgi:hypothetical protein
MSGIIIYPGSHDGHPNPKIRNLIYIDVSIECDNADRAYSGTINGYVTPAASALIKASPDVVAALRFIVEQCSDPSNADHKIGDYLRGSGFDMAVKALAKVDDHSRAD